MAITFLELSKELNEAARYLEGEEHGNIMVKLASEALALNRQRVTQDGKNAEGASFKPYSTKPMLSNRKGMTTSAYNSIAGSKDKRKDLKWVTIGGHKLFEIPGGYKEYRNLAGRQTGFVDFVMTGRMWNNIKLVSDKSELNSGVAVIKATEELQQKKLEGNTEKRGDILALSTQEVQRLADLYSAWVESALRKYGLYE